MPNTVLGKVSVVPRGDYSASTTYYALDIVGYQGGSYMGLKESTGVTPSNDQVNWMQLSGPGLPGEQGPQGNPGAAAGFGEATATVDDTSGTPSVEVETSGPDTAKVFTFKFYGLKGTKGDTGNKGDTGDTGPVGPQGVSVVTAQINEQGHLIITLSEGEPIDAGDATGPIGPQGVQGEAGESVGSIHRTSGTGAPGTTDTYTMYSTDGSEIGTFTVYNGTNGTGAGDFMADGSVPMTGNLDMNGNRVTEVGTPTADTDAANKGYVDEAVSNMEITTDTTPTQGSTNPVQSGGVYTALSNKQDTLSGTEDQLVGFNAAGEAVAVAAPDPLPTGGEVGQVLTKTSDGTAWDDVPSDLPDGGTDGQILTKTDDGVAWENPPDTGVTTFNGRKGEVSPGADDYSASMIKFTDGQTFQQKYDAGQLTGPAGANGSNGQDGSPGADGEDGGYYQPDVDGSGNLTWTASKPGMPAVSGANIKGATGPAGTNGTDGKNATINGVNALTLEVVEGAGIVGTQTGTTFKIDATELFQSVSDGKSAIAAAITDKGVTTAADATFQQMADNITAISAGGETKILEIASSDPVIVNGNSVGYGTNISIAVGSFVQLQAQISLGDNSLITESGIAIPAKEGTVSGISTFAPPQYINYYFVMPNEKVIYS